MRVAEIFSMQPTAGRSAMASAKMENLFFVAMLNTFVSLADEGVNEGRKETDAGASSSVILDFLIELI